MSDIQPPTGPPPPPSNLEQQAADIRNAAEIAALGLFVSTAEMTAYDLRLMEQIVDDLVNALTSTTLGAVGSIIKGSTIATIAKAAVDAVTEGQMAELEDIVIGIRKANAAAPARDPGELSLARQGARNFATQAYAFAVEHVGKHLPTFEGTGLTLKKTWVSQGDSRVRALHRRLHGRTTPIEGDFWRWPGTGQRLRFPGDPLAPPDATIGCRCLCWLSWSKPGELSKAVRTLPAMEDLPS